jgi:hypothetical protein
MPVKDSHTKIKPLPLANGHVRYTHGRHTRTDTCVRWGMAVTCNRHKFVTVSILIRLHNGRFTSETAAQRFQKRSGHLDPEVVYNTRWKFYSLYNSFSRRGRWAWL